MSEVAISQELYDLSGWVDTTYFKDGKHCFDYTLGFLVRKLPKTIEVEKDIATLVLGTTADFGELWIADYELMRANSTYPNTECIGEASTPEDAAAKLCCELIRQGIIKP